MAAAHNLFTTPDIRATNISERLCFNVWKREHFVQCCKRSLRIKCRAGARLEQQAITWMYSLHKQLIFKQLLTALTIFHLHEAKVKANKAFVNTHILLGKKYSSLSLLIFLHLKNYYFISICIFHTNSRYMKLSIMDISYDTANWQAYRIS